MDHSPRFLSLVNEVKQRIREISVQEAATLAKSRGVFLVDVREESEWKTSRAVGAIHLGKGVIERDIEKAIPDTNATILCYCGGGFRSALVADNLQKMGYTRVWSVTGGFKGWQAAGLPITSKPEVFPRSPYEKLGGLVHLPRLIDKARLVPQGKLPGYNYLTVGFDKFLLDFLCVEGAEFEKAVQQSSDDLGVLGWLKNKLGPAWPSDHAINDFNEKLIKRRPDTPEKQSRFDQMRASLPVAKKRIETYFDLIDLDEGRLA